MATPISEAETRIVRRHVGYSRFDEWLGVEESELKSLWDESEGNPLICAALILEALAADEDETSELRLSRFSQSLTTNKTVKQALLEQAAGLRAQAGQSMTPILTPWQVGS